MVNENGEIEMVDVMDGMMIGELEWMN